MHDIEIAIAQWRASLADTIGARPDVLDELESHLREDFERRLRQGQHAEAALAAALAAIGSPESLGAEFAKLAQPWLPIRLITGALALTAVLLLGLIALRLARGANDHLLAAHVSMIALGYIASHAIGVLMLCYCMRRSLSELEPGQQTSLRRFVFQLGVCAFGLTLAGVLLGAIWADGHLHRFWGWDAREVGGLIVLLWQLALVGLTWRTQSRLSTLMCWGLLGNLAATYAWFIAPMLGDLHSYGQAAIPGLLTATFLVHLAALASALLPSGWAHASKNAA